MRLSPLTLVGLILLINESLQVTRRLLNVYRLHNRSRPLYMYVGLHNMLLHMLHVTVCVIYIRLFTTQVDI